MPGLRYTAHTELDRPLQLWCDITDFSLENFSFLFVTLLQEFYTHAIAMAVYRSYPEIVSSCMWLVSLYTSTNQSSFCYLSDV